MNTSLAAPGALAHRLQRRTACNTSPPNISKMADGAWKYVKPYVIDPSDQLLLNKFFDPSTLSMRKGRDGGEKMKKKIKKKNKK